VVVGATGGIGSALTRLLVAHGGFAAVHGWSRSPGAVPPGALADRIDLLDEDGIAAACARLPAPPRLAIVATGVLHGAGLVPEKTYKSLDAEALLQAYRINAIGPALVAKHLLPRMAHPGRSVFAVLSARIGSIGDNRSGGWHAYRASKAALNMLIRTVAIELGRRRPETLCVGLHPGTVDTPLSRPFQRGVAPERLFDPDHAAARLLTTIDGLTPAQHGGVVAYDGSMITP
jgi:NAD(P)-dependent dehydrogenase (short-subunit alcohol dehydrogenase family)